MVGRCYHFRHAFMPRRVAAFEVADEGTHEWLIECCPILNAITERARDNIGVVYKCLRRRTCRPATLILKCLGKVPMVQGDKGRNSGL